MDFLARKCYSTNIHSRYFEKAERIKKRSSKPQMLLVFYETDPTWNAFIVAVKSFVFAVFSKDAASYQFQGLAGNFHAMQACMSLVALLLPSMPSHTVLQELSANLVRHHILPLQGSPLVHGL